MRVLMAQVYNPDNESFANLELPASYEELQDILQIVNGSNENCSVDIRYFLGSLNPLEGKTIKSCNLYELNYFATLYNNLQEYEQVQFAGLVEASTNECTEIKEIINLALNAPNLDCYYAPVTTDKDLGKFYVDNELLPQLGDLEDLSDEQYDWVCDHLDLEKIGKEMREQEHGVFTCAGYFVKKEEAKQLYDGNPALPQPADYIFRLEFALIPEGDEPNDQNTLSLKLPAGESEIRRVLVGIGAESMEDCCFYGYESLVVPQLADCYGDNDDFNVLNYLSEQISKLDDDGLAKYKAMLEATECKDIETALAVYEKMENFTLDRSCATITDYVDKLLETLHLPMKEELSFYLSKDGYGRALMQHNGIDNTPYGILIPNDGIKLSEQIQNQTEGMEITMLM